MREDLGLSSRDFAIDPTQDLIALVVISVRYDILLSAMEVMANRPMYTQRGLRPESQSVFAHDESEQHTSQRS